MRLSRILPAGLPCLLPGAPAWAQAESALLLPAEQLSPLRMFLGADLVVQSVMVGLLFASVLTWTVFVVKLLELGAALSRARRGLARIEGAGSLAEALRAGSGLHDPASRMLRAAADEYARTGRAGSPGLQARVAQRVGRIEAHAARRIARGTGLLAIIGSTAPFVGLFGTVWGIMNSFIGIAEAQTSNLAVVAPGIAEALLATGLGLVAAIPAVVIYNLFARATAGYRLRLGDARAAVACVISRELDHAAGGQGDDPGR